ncbi:type II toxin-antitoxin system ParD family antitoxin [Pseudoroseomonas wenyumeiae]
MNVSIGQRWEGFVESVVRSGRYGSASEVVREGLRLVEERRPGCGRSARPSMPRSPKAAA